MYYIVINIDCSMCMHGNDNINLPPGLYGDY